MITPERFLMVYEGKLYELVKSKGGCKECELDPSDNPDDCSRRSECAKSADVLFGSLSYRHWRLVCTKGY